MTGFKSISSFFTNLFDGKTSKKVKKSGKKHRKSSHKKHKLHRGAATKCPKGKILRKSYKKKSGTRVKSACVPDVGRPGKGGPVKIPIDDKHLHQYGYDLKHSSTIRHKALKKAIKATKKTSVLKRLVVLRTYLKYDRTKSGMSRYKKLNADVKYLQKKYFSK